MRIGIDLGGTKTEVIVLDEAGRSLFRKRQPTPRGDYDATLDGIRRLVEEAADIAGDCHGVGVGMPGAISPATGRVKNANSTWLNGRLLGDDLATCLRRPVRLANDANCFALSEAADGAGRGAEVVFGVILGTGCGGGLVVHGRVIAGPNAIAGEWGHNPLPWAEPDEQPGPPCYCGKRGCLETFVSGPGLLETYRTRSGDLAVVEPATIVARAAAGEAQAREALDRYVSRLARGLAAVINVIDPDVIVLGGGLSKIDMLYSEIAQRLPRWVFSDRVNTAVVPPHHGDSSGVRGAARLWPA